MSEELEPEPEDWSDCFITFEQSKAEYEKIERQLAMRFGITENIRETLIRMHKDNTLIEDDLVQDWLQAMAGYDDYVERHGDNDDK